MIVPGKILVIDDVREDVEGLIDSLMSRGEYVVYSSGFPSDEFLLNVRLLILDFYLIPNDRTNSVALIASILEKLNEQTRFFLIAIWSKFVNGETGTEMINEIKEKFHERTKKDLLAIFLKPFGKKISAEELMKKIEEFIVKQPEPGLIYELERIVEDARDKVVSDILHAGNMGVLLNALEKQVGKESLERCTLQLFSRILNRYTQPTKTMRDCIESLIGVMHRATKEGYATIHRLQAYYNVKDTESPWTGDVLMKSSNTEKSYCVIISPACDFAQKKLDSMKIIHATRIEDANLSKEEGLRHIKNQLNLKFGGKQIVDVILRGGSQLPRKYYVLQFLKNEEPPIFFHLVLDFEKVDHIPFKPTAVELKDEGWKRICRIDDPWISDILQKYSSYSSRIGVFEVPEDVIKNVKNQIGR